MTWAFLRRVVVCVALFSFVQACTAVTDLDRFKDACEGDITQQRDFTAELHNMAAFVPDNNLARARIELRIANIDDGDRPQLIARAVVDGFNAELEDDTVNVFMPRAVPPGQHQVHLFVDQNRNGQYDRVEHGSIVTVNEPSWIADLCSSGVLTFTANDVLGDITDPEPSAIGRDFELEITGFEPHVDGKQKLEMLVLHQNNAVGYYRRADINEATVVAAIPGIIIPQELYRIDFYADKNQNGIYDGRPSDDHSWRLERTSNGNGIAEVWPHSGTFQDVEF